MGLTILYMCSILYLSVVLLEFIVGFSLLYNWDNKVTFRDMIDIAILSLFVVVLPFIIYNVCRKEIK